MPDVLEKTELLLMGASAIASAVAGLFFLRFWRDTRDRLFAIFAASFFLLGLTRLGLALTATLPPTEAHTHWYWVRLLAFVLILVAIVDKNRRRD